eukprot:Platyproteum_vivax@DN6849_c0_g1_i1.p1
MKAFNKYLEGDLTLQASKGGTFVIFVGRPTQLQDINQWRYKDDYSLVEKYDGHYKEDCIIAINHESPELKEYLEDNRIEFVQALNDRLKELEYQNYRALAQFVEDGKKLQKGSYVANRLKTDAKIDENDPILILLGGQS